MPYITVRQFADKYGITLQAVRDRIRRGKLKYKKGWTKVEVTLVLDGLASQVVKKSK